MQTALISVLLALSVPLLFWKTKITVFKIGKLLLELAFIFWYCTSISSILAVPAYGEYSGRQYSISLLLMTVLVAYVFFLPWEEALPCSQNKDKRRLSVVFILSVLATALIVVWQQMDFALTTPRDVLERIFTRPSRNLRFSSIYYHVFYQSLFGPIFEEIVFANIFLRLRSFLKLRSLAYMALVVVWVLGHWGVDVSGALQIAAFRISMTYLFEKSGNIYRSILVHIFNNLLSFLPSAVTAIFLSFTYGFA